MQQFFKEIWLPADIILAPEAGNNISEFVDKTLYIWSNRRHMTAFNAVIKKHFPTLVIYRIQALITDNPGGAAKKIASRFSSLLIHDLETLLPMRIALLLQGDEYFFEIGCL